MRDGKTTEISVRKTGLFKRIFDLCFATLLLIFSLPLWIFAAVGIKLSSSGPVFYRAERAGRGRQPFNMVKFRTMHVATSERSAITMKNDQRIFRFGNLLRVTKIDELPQLLSILKGDMSFVGPRPEDPGIVERQYKPWMMETLSVAPGLTSPGTLYFMRHASSNLLQGTTEEDYGKKVLEPKLKLDLDYIRKQSVFADIGIISKTAFGILASIIRRTAL